MIDAYKRCIVSKSDQYGDWADKHQQSIDELMKLLPHGSGIDGDTTLEIDQCSPKQIVLASSFHVMDDNGMYSIRRVLLDGFDINHSNAHCVASLSLSITRLPGRKTRAQPGPAHAPYSGPVRSLGVVANEQAPCAAR